jgi:hypothetical protein
MNRLDREIAVLAGQLHRLPWGDPARRPLAAVLRGKRARLRARLTASEARWNARQAQAAA